MLFIKTEEGVHEVVTISDEVVNPYSKEPYDDTLKVYTTKGGKYFYEADVIQENSSLKRLCDMYVVEYTWKLNSNRYRHFERNYLSAKEYFNNRVKDEDRDCKIYGMVWIKGEQGEPILKSVANFTANKDGELLYASN